MVKETDHSSSSDVIALLTTQTLELVWTKTSDLPSNSSRRKLTPDVQLFTFDALGLNFSPRHTYFLRVRYAICQFLLTT